MFTDLVTEQNQTKRAALTDAKTTRSWRRQRRQARLGR